MTIQKAIELFKQHQKGTLRKSTLKSYGKFLRQIEERFAADEVAAISAEEVGKFLDERTEGLSKSTRHLRYAQIKAFFNYVIETSALNIKNPCSATVLLKTFKNSSRRPRKILDKETVVVFRDSLTLIASI
ncbi:MAG: site-specific integrase [Thermodesulfovibrionales bacterium]